MGVLACDRYCCKNIMCDRLSHEYGYICNECFEELVESNINPDNMNFDIQGTIEDFMNSTKRSYDKHAKDYALEFFSKFFPHTKR